MMRTAALVTATMLLGAGIAEAAGQVQGSGALALGALVGVRSPTLASRDRQALAALLEGSAAAGFPARRRITVTAASVSCRSSDVDIAEHSCTLTFGPTKRTLNGRAAHELYATLIEAGVPSDGAAGSVYEAASHLNCTVTPGEVRQKAGGGATCTFSPGP